MGFGYMALKLVLSVGLAGSNCPESAPGVCVRVARDEGQAVRCPLGQRYLQGVVVGVVIVGQPEDVAQIRVFAILWLSQPTWVAPFGKQLPQGLFEVSRRQV